MSKARGAFAKTLLVVLRQAAQSICGTTVQTCVVATGMSEPTVRRYAADLIKLGMLEATAPVDTSSRIGHRKPVAYCATYAGYAEIRKHAPPPDHVHGPGDVVRANLVPRFGGVYVPAASRAYYRNDGNRHIPSRGVRC